MREWQSTIIFLHKLVKGGTNRSYGIQVAGLAGVPDIVVQRAGVILREIELGKFGKSTDPLLSRKKSSKTKKHPDQLTLFSPPSDPIREYLQQINLDQCAPLDALNTLYSLKEMLKK